MREWYVLTYLFGAFFVAGQVYEYAELAMRASRCPPTAYGSVFYLTTGFHGLHVTGGLHRLPAHHRPHLHHPALHPCPSHRRRRDLVLLALRRRRLDRPVRHDLPAQVTRSTGLPSQPPRRPKDRTVERLGRPPPPPRRDRDPPAPRAGPRPAPPTPLLAPKSAQAARRPPPTHVADGQASSSSPTARPATASTPRARRPARPSSASAPPRSTSRSAPAACRWPAPASRRQRQDEIKFNDEQIAAMAAYVASLAPGPAIPAERVPQRRGRRRRLGGELFRVNCAMCHNFAGSGGALTRGKYAPTLRDVEGKHIYEAMLTGPQSMPVFNDQQHHAREQEEHHRVPRRASTSRPTTAA